MVKWAWALAGVMLLTGPAAADVTLDAGVDRDKIALSDQVNLTVTVLGETDGLSAPELPPLSDFAVVGTGSRQNLVIDNGQISQSTSYTYTLLPRRTGALVIGPVTLATPAGKLSTKPLTIQVVQDAATRPSQRNVDPGSTNRNGRRAETDPFFVKARVDKDTVYLGEQLTYTFAYYRLATLSESNNYTPPQTTGFISVDLPPQRKRTTVVEGETYSMVEVVTAMFPTRTGEMVIGPARLRVVPDVFSNLLGGDPFNLLRNRSRSPLTSGEPRNLATQAMSIQVKPLPPVPRGRVFSGAVGVCQLAASISDDSVGVGDPVTITWTLSGDGRKNLVDAPQVQWPDGLETFPPTTDLKTTTRNDVVAETKTFSIALVPRREGQIDIPAPELTYFNPKSGAYETARGRSLRLRVGPPRAGLTMVAPTSTISAAASTIRYLKSEPLEWRPQRGGSGEKTFLTLQLAGPVLVALVYAWRRRSEAPGQRARGARLKEMRKARQRIVGAARVADPKVLAQDVSSAFRGFLTARFDLAPGDLLGRDWVEALRSRGCATADIQAAVAILQSADRARFGGGTQGQHVATEAVLSLMERLDKCGG